MNPARAMNPRIRVLASRGLLVVLAILATGCASSPSEDDSGVAPVRVDYDPFEPLNRSMYAINDTFDRYTLRPIARGYKAVVPDFARRGVTNFSRNLATPRSAVNNFLQGKPGRGFTDLGRFLLNSTFGLAGLLDIATAEGIPEYDEDFGQTLAVWKESNKTKRPRIFHGPSADLFLAAPIPKHGRARSNRGKSFIVR